MRLEDHERKLDFEHIIGSEREDEEQAPPFDRGS